MTTRRREIGEFCWINILSPDTAAARDFFSNLLGWEYTEMPGMGHLIKVGGRDIGGLWENVQPGSSERLPPVVGVMVKVASADAAAARAVELGGTAQPAFDSGPPGRQAVIPVPNGAKPAGLATQGTPGP